MWRGGGGGSSAGGEVLLLPQIPSLTQVISKILANRLKIILPKFIAPNQSAFVKNRLLMENILLATEVIKDYHNNNVSPRCALKIDISKAFDSYISWIQTCIFTASFSVQVNGKLAGYFNSKRVLGKATGNNVFGYHPQCKHMKLTHLCFADDLLVFVDGQQSSITGVLKVFEDFATHSGLKVSMEKSTIYTAGITMEDREEILRHFPFEYGSLPVRYLGLPLLPKRMSSADYIPLLEMIKSKIGSWTARVLSFAGRLQLICSVISSITNFWISAFRLPKACIKEIDQLCSAFLWSGPSLNAKKTKVAWSEVCLPKREGGLGLRSIEEANKVSVLKLIWRLLSAKDSLWVNWVKRYLIRSGSIWTEKPNPTLGSWIWKKLLKYRDLAQQFHRVEAHNGEHTSFWFDIWSPLGRLYETLGERGCITMGIPSSSTLAEAVVMTRRRMH
ncbi:PREDICTED: uncharacterized protein LOC104743910 [Camelina sativa]|uniref:Uncharacterized protein LOC104743910 n=1 Tax=Camelina sativa TaxID=90675 RepID=A0ABM0VYT7_CAMSA|nr:PREDICTED: uncharacterized protein LOC104743910 [Camelina sativa]